VNLGTAPPTAAQIAQIQTLTDALSAAQDKFDTQSNIAYGKYLVSRYLYYSFLSFLSELQYLYYYLCSSTVNKLILT
jgi:hypothetical protein